MDTKDVPNLLWSPPEAFRKTSNLQHYIDWLYQNKSIKFEDYQSLWEWSTTEVPDFWESLWEYFKVIDYEGYDTVLSGDKMPYYSWFEGSKLNYAEHVFRNATSAYPAIIYKAEGTDLKTMSWELLKKQVAAVQDYLKEVGIGPGDRVVAYLPNSPEATVAFLAVNSIGAVWSCCSPDFGVSSVIDRFSQVTPKVFITIDGYRYGGKDHDKMGIISRIKEGLPTLESTVLIPYLNKKATTAALSDSVLWQDILQSSAESPEFTAVPFDHPIWVLYSSGTTGLPKAITHSQGGILLEHLKYLTFHNNVKQGDRCFWYTTTGWMMWNYIQSALLCGGTVVLYDGSPTWPQADELWQFAAAAKINHFGTSAGYIVNNMKGGFSPKADYDLSDLTSIGSTGSPLPPEGFDWVYAAIKKDLWLTSISGGTDICSAFVGGNPLWPVYAGEIQCRALGCKLQAYNEAGESVFDEVGEMVIEEPMPSMPVYFWDDPQYERYLSSYFELFPGKWRHGDWTKITPRYGVVIYGRSDATLNRGGVRIGTSEVYRAVDLIPEISDSLIICLERPGGNYYMPLFVVLGSGHLLDDDLKDKIKRTIRNEFTPRHVPDEIIAIEQVPYTISGKKTEAPVKKILMGKNIETAINKDALKNPEALDFFIKLAATYQD